MNILQPLLSLIGNLNTKSCFQIILSSLSFHLIMFLTNRWMNQLFVYIACCHRIGLGSSSTTFLAQTLRSICLGYLSYHIFCVWKTLLVKPLTLTCEIWEDRKEFHSLTDQIKTGSIISYQFRQMVFRSSLTFFSLLFFRMRKMHNNQQLYISPALKIESHLSKCQGLYLFFLPM